MLECSIDGCNSHQLSRNTSMHRLLRGGKFNKEWIEAIESLNGQYIDVLTIPKNFSICSMHFERNCQRKLGKNLYLTPWAIPTLFPKMFNQSKKMKPKNDEVDTTNEQPNVNILCNNGDKYKSLLAHNSEQTSRFEAQKSSYNSAEKLYIPELTSLITDLTSEQTSRFEAGATSYNSAEKLYIPDVTRSDQTSHKTPKKIYIPDVTPVVLDLHSKQKPTFEASRISFKSENKLYIPEVTSVTSDLSFEQTSRFEADRTSYYDSVKKLYIPEITDLNSDEISRFEEDRNNYSSTNVSEVTRVISGFNSDHQSKIEADGTSYNPVKKKNIPAKINRVISNLKSEQSYRFEVDRKEKLTRGATLIVEKPQTWKEYIYCGVLQCPTYCRNTSDSSMFEIPKYIRNCPDLLKKWSEVLRMEKPFSDDFKICSLHFEKSQILIPLKRDSKRILRPNAIPTLYLPELEPTVQTLEPTNCFLSKRNSCEKVDYENELNLQKKSTQVNLKQSFIFRSFCDTDQKLNALTGLDDKSSLDALVDEVLAVIKEDSALMTMRDRIILTTCRLKTNLDFEQLGVLFQIEKQISEIYFADTIKYLAKIVKPFIYWQSEEENIKNMPESFKYFPNVKTVVECITIKTHPGAEFLIGVAPSGLINYVSTKFDEFTTMRDMFLVSDLLTKMLKPKDAIIMNEDNYIEDLLFKVAIEMLTPQNEPQKDKIIAAKAEIEKQIEKLKEFKILSEAVDASLIPFIDDIIVVVCGLFNKSLINELNEE